MILAKLYTEEEGGKWKPLPFKFDKSNTQQMLRADAELNVDWPMRIGKLDGNDLSVYSLMFEDGTIYDSGRKQRFRSESDFPKDETIEYMNKILNGEI